MIERMAQVIEMTREQVRLQLLIDIKREAKKIADVVVELVAQAADLAGDKDKADMIREVGPNTIAVALELATTEFEPNPEATAINQALGYFKQAAGLAMAQLAGD